ncbi:hypothetical protein I2W78_15480 [Streptomyces spinoverrucosus]|uniref:hypothetical protein n=1 Tax=Streptomyces spinoverrucosus TaxID=284043 RepID=UPI0018C44F0D|nr:hypothetical protein [Streptomyces spinoverrucosus]MBG0853211.1 hypothetical protein [Streptomyces spinoverrucosus]
MEADAGNARHEHERDRDRLIDWLEHSPDLPHLIARVSEIVHRLGYAPEDLIVLPRRELDRRELAAYSAGWADVVAEQLPAIRKAYEERITAAYLQGQEDARTGRRPRRAEGAAGGGDGDVIPLPYVPLLDPPRAMTRVEERGERERTLAESGGRGEGGGRAEGGRDTDRGDARAEGGGPDKGAGILVSARDVRDRQQPATPDRRRVVRRNGRPSVPPLTRPGESNTGPRERVRTDGPESRDPDRPRLSEKARALADELEGRAAATARGKDESPDPPPGPH